MVNSSSGSTFVHKLIDLTDSLGDSSLDLKAAIDQAILDENSAFLSKLAELDTNMKNIKALLADAGGVSISHIDTLLLIENCKDSYNV
jgi:hypothetical protein